MNMLTELLSYLAPVWPAKQPVTLPTAPPFPVLPAAAPAKSSDHNVPDDESQNSYEDCSSSPKMDLDTRIKMLFSGNAIFIMLCS